MHLGDCCGDDGPIACAECMEHARAAGPSILNTMRMFGRSVEAKPELVGVGSLADDVSSEIESRLGPWLDQHARGAADSAFDQLQYRLTQNMDVILDDVAAKAQPKFLALFDDAETQARLGATSERVASDIQIALIPVMAGTAVVTAALTWLLVKKL